MGGAPRRSTLRAPERLFAYWYIKSTGHESPATNHHRMDNVTHTLFAATLARTPLGRAGRGTTAALLLASNAPDIDLITAVRGSVSYLTWHRGPTHGPVGIVALGLATAGLVWIGRDLVPR